MSAKGLYTIELDAGGWPDVVNSEELLALFARALRHLEPKTDIQEAEDEMSTIVFMLVNDEQIAAINKQHRGKDKPTDVVSLSYLHDVPFPGNQNLAGEIFISIDTARRQAKEHKKTLEQEVLFLFLHGVLHVFGYDHIEANERKEMFDLQDEILETDMWRPIIESQQLEH